MALTPYFLSIAVIQTQNRYRLYVFLRFIWEISYRTQSSFIHLFWTHSYSLHFSYITPLYHSVRPIFLWRTKFYLLETFCLNLNWIYLRLYGFSYWADRYTLVDLLLPLSMLFSIVLAIYRFDSHATDNYFWTMLKKSFCCLLI